MKTVFTLVITSVLFWGISISAQATDTKIISGTACNVINSNEASTVYYTSSGIRTTTEPVQVVCSVLRDYVGFGGTDQVSVYIEARAPGPGSITSCTASYSTIGGKQFQLIRSSIDGSGWVRLSGPKRQTYSTIVVNCSLPRHTYLGAIMIRESGNTSTN